MQKNILAQERGLPYLAELPSSVSICTADVPDPFGMEVYDLVELVWGGGQKDLSMLREPIHLQFANWRSTPDAVIGFTKRFGVLCECPFRVSDWAGYQERFRRYWEYNSQSDMWNELRMSLTDELVRSGPLMRAEFKDLLVLGKAEGEFTAPLALKQRGLELVPVLVASTLWQYLLIRLMGERLGRLRRCENPECSAPYFIAGRADQKFCSTDCAGLIAKRRWWAAHGAEWRRKWQKRRKKTRS